MPDWGRPDTELVQLIMLVEDRILGGLEEVLNFLDESFAF
jgi:hypothetical protein